MMNKYALPTAVRFKWGGLYWWFEIPWALIEPIRWEPDSRVKLVRGIGAEAGQARIHHANGHGSYKMRPIPKRDWSEVFFPLTNYRLVAPPVRGTKVKLGAIVDHATRSLLIPTIPAWFRHPRNE